MNRETFEKKEKKNGGYIHNRAIFQTRSIDKPHRQIEEIDDANSQL